MIRRIFLVLTLVGVAAVIVFARRDRPDRLQESADAVAPPQPGYYMTDANVIQTGADGRPMYRMRAERIQQNPADLTVQLQNLYLYYQPGASNSGPSSPWTLTAKSGVMPQDASRVDLKTDVEIKGELRVGDTREPLPATVRTAQLSVDLKNETARTRERVEAQWQGLRLSGTGLKADLKVGIIKLESNVHGVFTR